MNPKIYMNKRTGKLYTGIYLQAWPTLNYLVGEDRRPTYLSERWLSNYEYIGEL